MALDTIGKRLSVLAFGVAGLTLPIPDGTIASGDRQHLIGIPSSVTVSEEFPEPDVDENPVQVIWGAEESSLSAAGNFADLFSCQPGAEVLVAVPAGTSGLFRNWRITISVAPGVGKSWTFTVRINGVNTPMSITISDLSTTGRYTASDIAVTAGDLLSVSLVPTGGPAEGAPFNWSIEFQGDVPGTSIYGGKAGGGNEPNWYYGPFTVDPEGAHVFSFARKNIAACAGTLTATRMFTSATGSYEAFVNLNGVRQDGSGATVDTTLAMSGAGAHGVTFSLPIAPGDLVYIEVDKLGGSGGNWTVGAAFVATTPGQFHVCGGGAGATLPSGGTQYQTPTENEGFEWENTEDTRLLNIDAAITTVTLSGFRIKTSNPPGTGNTLTFTTRENEADTTIVAAISGNVADAAADLTHSVELVDGDRFALKCAVTGGPATGGTDAIWCWIGGASASEPPSGGGEIPPGVNPAPGDPVGDIHFAQFTIGGVDYFAGETLLRDALDNFGGKKLAQLKSFRIGGRQLAREGWPAQQTSLVVIDTPDAAGTMRWRGFSATATLESIPFAIYRCQAPYGEIIGTPFRLAAGLVKAGGFDGVEGYEFHFSGVDVLGDFFADPENQPEIPTKKLTVNEFWGMDPRFDGNVAQRAFGLLTEDGVGPVPGIYMGQINPAIDLNPAGVNALYHVLLLSEGAVYDISMVYVNPLTWGDGQLVFAGQLMIPPAGNGDPGAGNLFISQNGGTTGGSPPTFPALGTVNDNGVIWEVVGPYTGTLRYPIPAAAYDTGTDFTHVKAANWTDVTGLPITGYVDWVDGRRYSIALLRSTHHYAEALVDGRILPMFDLIGATTEVDGDGPPLLDPGYLHTYILLVYLFTHESTLIDEPVMPTLPGLPGETPYSVIDTVSADLAKAVADAEVSGGYRMGFLVGAGGQPESMWDVLSRLLRGGALECGPNRHGQLMYARRDNNATAVIAFNPQRDYLKTRYRIDAQRRCTRAKWRYGTRYADLFPAPPTGPEGDPDPSDNGVRLIRKGQWQSGQQTMIAPAAETALGTAFGQARKKPLTYDNAMTRDAATARAVVLREVDYGAGPAPSYHGTWLVDITGPDATLLMRLDSNGKTRELNDVFELDDEQGMAAAGFSAKRFRIVDIDHGDAQNFGITFTAEALDATVVTVTDA